ncbi:MAG: metalloregulator ArsR/SmtB family transcription factor [Spirochaetales bacterium]|nr:metalloregulator ArsR/SmtB family transcription factor [Spirochaetales bacterium]
MSYDKEKELAASRAKVIKSLGHPTRIFLVGLLSKESLSVGELTEAAGVDVSTVSKHLSLLKQAGLVIDQKQGNRVLYTLCCPCILDFIHCVDEVTNGEGSTGISCALPGAK